MFSLFFSSTSCSVLYSVENKTLVSYTEKNYKEIELQYSSYISSIVDTEDERIVYFNEAIQDVILLKGYYTNNKEVKDVGIYTPDPVYTSLPKRYIKRLSAYNLYIPLRKNEGKVFVDSFYPLICIKNTIFNDSLENKLYSIDWKGDFTYIDQFLDKSKEPSFLKEHSCSLEARNTRVYIIDDENELTSFICGKGVLVSCRGGSSGYRLTSSDISVGLSLQSSTFRKSWESLQLSCKEIEEKYTANKGFYGQLDAVDVGQYVLFKRKGLYRFMCSKHYSPDKDLITHLQEKGITLLSMDMFAKEYPCHLGIIEIFYIEDNIVQVHYTDSQTFLDNMSEGIRNGYLTYRQLFRTLRLVKGVIKRKNERYDQYIQRLVLLNRDFKVTKDIASDAGSCSSGINDFIDITKKKYIVEEEEKPYIPLGTLYRMRNYREEVLTVVTYVLFTLLDYPNEYELSLSDEQECEEDDTDTDAYKELSSIINLFSSGREEREEEREREEEEEETEE